MARRWRSVWHSCDTLHLWFWRWAVPWARLVLLFLWNFGVFCPWGWLRDIIVHGGWWKKVGLGSSRYRFLQKIRANLRESFDPVENLPEIEFGVDTGCGRMPSHSYGKNFDSAPTLGSSQRVSLENKVSTNLLWITYLVLLFGDSFLSGNNERGERI